MRMRSGQWLETAHWFGMKTKCEKVDFMLVNLLRFSIYASQKYQNESNFYVLGCGYLWGVCGCAPLRRWWLKHAATQQKRDVFHTCCLGNLHHWVENTAIILVVVIHPLKWKCPLPVKPHRPLWAPDYYLSLNPHRAISRNEKHRLGPNYTETHSAIEVAKQ